MVLEESSHRSYMTGRHENVHYVTLPIVGPNGQQLITALRPAGFRLLNMLRLHELASADQTATQESPSINDALQFEPDTSTGCIVHTGNPLVSAPGNP